MFIVKYATLYVCMYVSMYVDLCACVYIVRLGFTQVDLHSDPARFILDNEGLILMIQAIRCDLLYLNYL